MRTVKFQTTNTIEQIARLLHDSGLVVEDMEIYTEDAKTGVV